MSEFNLPFLFRVKNEEDADWLAGLLQEKFGYHQGNFVSDGKNVRGECDEYGQDYLKGYVGAISDIDDGTIDIGENSYSEK